MFTDVFMGNWKGTKCKKVINILDNNYSTFKLLAYFSFKQISFTDNLFPRLN